MAVRSILEDNFKINIEVKKIKKDLDENSELNELFNKINI
jgi:hypothetical protein